MPSATSRPGLKEELVEFVASRDFSSLRRGGDDEMFSRSASPIESVNLLMELLDTSPSAGIDSSSITTRKEEVRKIKTPFEATQSCSSLSSPARQFDVNVIKEKEMTPFWRLAWEASKDFVIVALVVLAVVSLLVETIPNDCSEGSGHDDLFWLEVRERSCHLASSLSPPLSPSLSPPLSPADGDSHFVPNYHTGDGDY